ncbi:MAG: hypothetical protein KGO48_14240 [Alphaproteobacteria bacterium]|nr:hypothetical protein [Alphaproteobacteria bacterium]
MHEMGRAWQFFLTVAITAIAFAYLYYTSDYYAKRSAPPSPVAAATVAPAAVPVNK